MNKTTFESLKEMGRVLVLAILPIVLTQLADVKDPTIWVVLGTAVLRALDKAVHVSDRTTKNGLLPF